MIAESLVNHQYSIADIFYSYIRNNETTPLFLVGDALSVLKQIPSDSIDMCMTSPPYWQKRQYDNGGVGLENNYQDYIINILAITKEIKRILKPTGSFWLNIGDSYLNKNLMGIPWRIALRLTDEQQWVLRNSIIWNKVKGGLDNTTDRLANTHENLFHFVKSAKGYYYDSDQLRSDPRKSRVVNGAVVSATGVSGIRYKRQIELSTALTPAEKDEALKALNEVLRKVSEHEIDDFRMIIRGQQRTTHSNSEKLSGRAKELKEKGFYFLLYHPKGSKPGDVWEIIPEDRQARFEHFAPYPEDLCKIPILATCPTNGIVIDPFCGTGTTNYVARTLQRKSIGIDISKEYVQFAEERCSILL
jgi:DNA modification methylase